MKKGRRLSDSLVLYPGIAKHHPHRQVYGKVHVLNGHGTFRILVLVCEIGDFGQREQEQIALCYIYVEKIGSCSPIVNEISD